MATVVANEKAIARAALERYPGRAGRQYAYRLGALTAAGQGSRRGNPYTADPVDYWENRTTRTQAGSLHELELAWQAGFKATKVSDGT